MKRVLIVGGGMAGLACGARLGGRGVDCTVLEAADGVGGRVRTDVVDGFRLDRGFQVLLTAYPATRSLLNYGTLDLRPFNAGAIVRRGGRSHRAFDPLRHPSDSFAAAASPLFTVGDKMRLAKLWAEVLASSPEALLSSGPERTTEAELTARGFSTGAIEAFFRPFFGGIFCQPVLSSSSRLFRYLFRLFATGRAAVPALGMGELPAQLARRFVAAGGRLRLKSAVVDVSAGGVTLATGERLTADAVVVATDLPAARRLLPGLGNSGVGRDRSTCTVYFEADSPVVGSKSLVLNGDGPGAGPVNTLAEMSAASADYAPPGRVLVAASVLTPRDDDAELHAAIRRQMTDWVGPAALRWRHLRTDRVAFALPPADPPTMADPHRPVRVGPGVFVCGDHREQPSIEGAITSGLRAADAVVRSDG